jgi:hypothetical protein
MRCAPLFQLVMMPSRVRPMIASCDVSTIEASRARSSSCRLLDYDNLERDVRRVVRTLSRIEQEVMIGDGAPGFRPWS